MNLLFCGLGGIGQRYLRIIKNNFPKSNLYSYTTRKNFQKFEIDNNLKLKKVDIYKKYNLTRISNTREIKPKFFDATFITNPTSMHITTCLEISNKSKKILIEKPLSNNLNKIKFIKKKNNIFTANVFRYHPIIIELKKIIESKNMGKLKNGVASINSFMPDWHKYEDYKKLYASQKKLGGGVVLTESHELDTFRYLFGLPEKVFKILGHEIKYKLNVESKANCALLYLKKNI